MNTKELAAELRADGLSFREVAKVLNDVGLRTDSGLRFTHQTAWQYSTYGGGERCPRSGLWNRTCTNFRDDKVHFERGEIFPHCSTCDSCKWAIVSLGGNQSSVFRRSKSKSNSTRRQTEVNVAPIANSHEKNTTLEDDRKTLLAVKGTLAGAASLNWNDRIPVEAWDGVTVSRGRVTKLNLREKGLTGAIPPLLGKLSALESLVLENNALRGCIPPELGSLSNLKDLWLKYNQLTGGIPPELGSLTSLERFTAINNQLTGSIPDTLGDLSNLQELWLGNNQLSGEIPTTFGKLSRLRELWLKNNRLTGSVPEELHLLPNLQRLVIDKNLIADSPPSGDSASRRMRKRGSGRETAPKGHSAGTTRRKSRRSKGNYDKEFSEKWASRDAEATEFFVYILKLDGNVFYAGQTRELRERLMEHRDGDTVSTAGKNPRLVWFIQVSTRDEAVTLEAELKRLCDKNPREIYRRIGRFQVLVEQLDFS